MIFLIKSRSLTNIEGYVPDQNTPYLVKQLHIGMNNLLNTLPTCVPSKHCKSRGRCPQAPCWTGACYPSTSEASQAGEGDSISGISPYASSICKISAVQQLATSKATSLHWVQWMFSHVFILMPLMSHRICEHYEHCTELVTNTPPCLMML